MNIPPSPIGGGEVKSLVVATSTNLERNQTGRLINFVASGTGLNDRVGRTIMLRRLEWRASASMMSELGATGDRRTLPSFNRFILFYDKQFNADLIVGDDLLTPIAGNTTSFSPFNPDNEDRYLILHDEYFDLGGMMRNNSGGLFLQIPPCIWHSAGAIDLDLLTVYSGTSSVNTIQTGALCALFISDLAPAVSPNPNIVANAVFKWYWQD